MKVSGVAYSHEHWPRLAALGCTYAQGGDANNLYSVDMPHGVDVHAAYQMLEEGELAGGWIFEDGHYQTP